MKLFSDEELDTINKELLGKTGNFLIAFRNKHGPTLLKKLWTEMLEELGHSVKCLSWWSSAGRLGLLECETENGLDAGTVTSSAMRAYRIGESGGEKE